MLNRRQAFRAFAASAAAIAAGSPDVLRAATRPTMIVDKDPGCGCCDGWADHMRAAGFTVQVKENPDRVAHKQRLGIPADFRTCHTGVVDGYVVDGHVPADLVQKMLTEKPAIRGIAVPGMPVGSPGMEVGDRKDPYDVIAFTAEGKKSVYAKR
jgi:hypothetical protein